MSAIAQTSHVHARGPELSNRAGKYFTLCRLGAFVRADDNAPGGYFYTTGECHVKYLAGRITLDPHKDPVTCPTCILAATPLAAPAPAAGTTGTGLCRTCGQLRSTKSMDDTRRCQACHMGISSPAPGFEAGAAPTPAPTPAPAKRVWLSPPPRSATVDRPVLERVPADLGEHEYINVPDVSPLASIKYVHPRDRKLAGPDLNGDDVCD